MRNVKILFSLLFAFTILCTCFNSVNATNNYRTVSSIISYSGDISDAGEITGEFDGDYATMIAYYTSSAHFPAYWGQYEDAAIIVGQMSGTGIGEIWLRCCKPSAEYPWFGVMVYTSNDLQNWNCVGTINVTGATLDWYEITTLSEPGYTPVDPLEGYAPAPYNYIAIAIISTDPSTNPYLYLDAVAAQIYPW